MHNVVSLRTERSRPHRSLGVPRDGARILFFTGVRYCRDEAAAEVLPSSVPALRLQTSERMLDAAAH